MRYFTIFELTKSATASAKGIANVPGTIEKYNLEQLINNVLDPLREHVGKPITISSGYRCPKLNAAVGGVANSQHVQGEAADIKIPSLAEGKQWFEYISKALVFDQLILEHNKAGVYWIHVSYRKGHNRNQVINNLLKK